MTVAVAKGSHQSRKKYIDKKRCFRKPPYGWLCVAPTWRGTADTRRESHPGRAHHTLRRCGCWRAHSSSLCSPPCNVTTNSTKLNLMDPFREAGYWKKDEEGVSFTCSSTIISLEGKWKDFFLLYEPTKSLESISKMKSREVLSS